MEECSITMDGQAGLHGAYNKRGGMDMTETPAVYDAEDTLLELLLEAIGLVRQDLPQMSLKTKVEVVRRLRDLAQLIENKI